MNISKLFQQAQVYLIFEIFSSCLSRIGLAFNITQVNTSRVELRFIAGLKYTPTSVIFIKIPSISKFQWHPFTLASSSSTDEHSMSAIIKCEGHWTSSLYRSIHSEQDAEANQRQCIPVALEGPYGPASQDFLRYQRINEHVFPVYWYK